MIAIHGGHKSRRKHSHRVRRLRGGHSPSPLNPADYLDGANMSDLAGNFAKPPNAFPSNQVGGGYGFVNNEADIPSFAGSYFPVSKVCTAGEFDLARGGNNFVGGGANVTMGLSRSGGGRRSKRSSSSKKTCGGTRRKFKQSGCNKKGGKRRRTHKRSSHKKRRSHKRKQRGGLAMIA